MSIKMHYGIKQMSQNMERNITLVLLMLLASFGRYTMSKLLS